MSARKTPILLRRTGLSDRVVALYRYRRVNHNGKELIDCGSEGRWDVTEDFEELVLALLLDESPALIEALDGAALDMELTEDERAQIRTAREKLREMAERHNDRVGAKAKSVGEHPGANATAANPARADQKEDR